LHDLLLTGLAIHTGLALNSAQDLLVFGLGADFSTQLLLVFGLGADFSAQDLLLILTGPPLL